MTFAENQKDHAAVGGEVLTAQHYKYWREVFDHGIPQKEYDSSMLRLLNYEDMTTGANGEDMSIKERINDIAARYGKNSSQENVVKAVASQIEHCM